MERRICKITTSICFIFCICNFSNAIENQKLLIYGQVVDYMARPVEDAEIAIIHRYDYNKMLAPFVKTDKDGRFEVQVNATSKYAYIVARKKGMAYAWDGLNYQGQAQGKMEFLLVLEKANTLTGKVVDYNGKPVPGASVAAIPKNCYSYNLYQSQIFGPAEWFTAKTDSNGIFSFDYFSKDVSSDFQVKAPACNCTYKYTTHYQAAYGFEVWRTDIKLVLPQERKIKGRVIEEGTSKPAGDVELLIKTGRDLKDITNCYLPVTVVSDSDGSFICEGLPEGNHIIELVTKETEVADWAAEQVEVNVSPEELNGDIKVKLRKGGIIECAVREYKTGKFLPGALFDTYKGSYHTRTITNEKGITRQRVLPGKYRAYSVAEGYVQWMVNDPVIVKDGEVTHVDIELAKSPAISGTVVDNAGKPAPDVMVTIHPYGNHVYTNKDGRFTTGYYKERTDQGIYIVARDLQRSLSASLYTKDLDTPVKLSLSPALNVKGKIVDPHGNGIPAAKITLGIEFTGLSLLGAQTLTDSNGLFEFKAIPSRKTNLHFWHSLEAEGFTPKVGALISFDGEPGITFDAGALKLESANLSVSGTVIDANGTPMPCSAIHKTGIGWPKYTTTDELGRYEIRGLSEGAIKLQADSDTGGSGTTSAQFRRPERQGRFRADIGTYST